MAPKMPTYYETAEEINRIQRRRALRQQLQNEFNRVVYNPYRLHNHIELLDPAVSRYTAMRAAIYEHWKPSWKSFWKFAFTCWVPVIAGTFYMKYRFTKREEECRTHKVPYKQRHINRI